MNNSEAFQFFCEHKSHSYRSIADQFIASFGFEQSDMNSFRLKFNEIQKERDLFTKNSNLDTWNLMYFCHIPKRPKLSSTSTISFEEDLKITKRKDIGDLTTKALRNRLSSLKSHLDTVAQNEGVSPKTLASYLLLLCSNEDLDFSSAKVCKEIINKGNYSHICPQLSLDKSAFLIDSLEIGKSKYLELRRTLLSDNLKLPGYNRVAVHRAQVNLVDGVRLIHREFPIGVGISYTRLLSHTVERIVMNLNVDNQDFPLKVKMSDGLVGSGCHRVYQQARAYPELAKSFLLFGFKINAILNANNNILWKQHKPNSSYSTRPVALLAIPENEENVKFLMDSLINQETSTIEENGLSLSNGHAEVKIIRSHFGTKMAKILSGAGGASCQLCTASFAQIHDISFVNTGYPINRTIHDVRALFEEVDEDEFLSLPSIQRFNLTHKLISDKDIVSASPLHAYLRTFSWFLLLVSHLQCGARKWSPTSSKIVGAKRFITNQGFIQDFITIRLKLIASNFHTPKPMILYYVYGELPKFPYA